MKTLPLSLTLSAALLFTACGEVEVSSRLPAGNANAPITVMEFADLQCPACRAAHAQTTLPLIEQYGDKIRFEFRHFPLSTIHPYALSAAVASECAADQGKFWEFIDHNYEYQEDLSIEALNTWGEELGLDMDAYKSCRRSNGKKKLVLAEYKEGRDLGVQGTPTYFVNGVQTSRADLTSTIEAEIGSVLQNL